MKSRTSWFLVAVIALAGCLLLLAIVPEALLAWQKRNDAPEFPEGHEWLNSRPLSKKDLKGKIVLLDFWTYCCINCMHILPELKKLEEKYPNELVVVGVHSAKFAGERQTDNIREAILRYEITHPVINDDRHLLWDGYQIDTWPTIVLIDPDGKFVWRREAEFKAEEVETRIRSLIAGHKRKGTLSLEPIKFELEAQKETDTPLRFPGKLLADAKSDRLFIADSNHNRIVVASLDGKLIETIGAGSVGKADGDFATATFNHPQGLALHEELLYVADTENHMLRKVDLKAKKVTTIAGDGEQHPGPKATWPRGKPKTIRLSSPWDLWIHDDDLFIAMAGPHQIWRMRLDEVSIGPYAGNAQEDIVDGPLLPDSPYRSGFASFAQPSGLTSDGTFLYVADSEGSSIRAVTLGKGKEVVTVVGSAHLPKGQRLFAFGDAIGPPAKALFQHCLAVAYDKGLIYVADTYNNKIKVVDAKTGLTQLFAGTGGDGLSDNGPTFDEPGGLSIAGGKLYVADTNNHAARVIDLDSKRTTTLAIDGLTPPVKPEPKQADNKPDFTGAPEVKLKTASIKPVDGKITLSVELTFPKGWKVNLDGKPSYWVESASAKGPVDRGSFGKHKLTTPSDKFDIELPVTGKGLDALRISMNYYYCSKADAGQCKVGAVVFAVPVSVSDAGKETAVSLSHQVAN